ncbi:DsbA family oxidoreductase [Paenibacillus lignilyticus]|uniref:DsbA family oxidoreductase n=1 Tax=Paenibacillus lignilyticus TaxID=1172615 RepID=A0ABS5CB58_9BACL|nr:DsbA family oxidoreductase [Paenibacillus lignilyticus]
MNQVTIDVYFDTICPWCRMGTTSLLAAVEQLPEDTKATVRWHAFQLNPDIRPEGEDYRKVMIGRLGGTAQFEARMKQYNTTGAQFGLNYNMDLVKYTPNTTKSHQLVAITPEHLQVQLIEALYKAYFEEGIDIGNVDELVRIAIESKAADDADALKSRLMSGEGIDKVEAGQRNAQKLGVRGVPYFIINEKVSLSGLQSPDEFINVIKQTI